MNNVIKLPIITTANHDPDDILEAAKGNLDNVIILGSDKNGDRWLSGSFSDFGEIIVNLEMAKAWVLREMLSHEDDAKGM